MITELFSYIGRLITGILTIALILPLITVFLFLFMALGVLLWVFGIEFKEGEN